LFEPRDPDLTTTTGVDVDAASSSSVAPSPDRLDDELFSLEIVTEGLTVSSRRRETDIEMTTSSSLLPDTGTVSTFF